MPNPIDKRGILNEEVFTYKITKDKKVFIYCDNKAVTTLSGIRADAFITKISNADGKDAQLIMAKATGNYKHGNEKDCKRRV
ncbi:MAG: hypothetical protein FWE91_13185 [Defluviitaleaceae bacterium]|nr:hypothetical protein [Defluviitaleaceae bacterium]MCL2835244.1 hypothetical protein [Defluviitaleaceae bacterium]